MLRQFCFSSSFEQIKARTAQVPARNCLGLGGSISKTQCVPVHTLQTSSFYYRRLAAQPSAFPQLLLPLQPSSSRRLAPPGSALPLAGDVQQNSMAPTETAMGKLRAWKGLR